MFMDMAPHNMAIRFYAGELSITKPITPLGKTYFLLNLPYFLATQTEGYIRWLEGEVEK